MTKKKSIIRNKNHDRKSMKTWYTGGAARWSDLNDDVLSLVMMQLGVIDFFAFGGVCKSWRSLAVSNKSSFMASRPPMFMRISPRGHKDVCYLIDFEGRKFKTIIPHLVGRTCFGLTCGYLILFGSKERDIWLVNPITRHELHFLDAPLYGNIRPKHVRVILVFSPSLSEWVIVMVTRYGSLWSSIAGKGTWNYVSSTPLILDLHAFKGKIFALSWLREMKYLCELRLGPEPKLTLLETKFPKTVLRDDLVSSNENLFLMKYRLEEDSDTVYELDFDEMRWTSRESTKEEHAFFLSELNHCAAVKQDLRFDPCLQRGRYADYEKSGKGRFFTADLWYFPHDCLNVHRIDE